MWKFNEEKYKKYLELRCVACEQEYCENENCLTTAKEFSKLYDWFENDKFESLPRLECCFGTQNYNSIILGCKREYYFEGKIIDCFWSIYEEYKDYKKSLNNFCVKNHIKNDRNAIEIYNSKKPKVKFCPFCGKNTPELILRTKEEINFPIADWSDGNYCNTCKERISSCKICYPELSAYKIKEE